MTPNIPEDLLKELESHTKGFVLFYVDEEGDSCFLPKCKPVAMAGLLCHAKNAAISFDELLLSQMSQLD